VAATEPSPLRCAVRHPKVVRLRRRDMRARLTLLLAAAAPLLLAGCGKGKY
jgi:hypothetical protein